MKASAVLASAIVAVGLGVFASAAQARTIYWTGYGAVNTGYGHSVWSCQSQASTEAEAGARESCVRDFGIRRSVCDYAPVERTEDLGTSYSWDGTVVYCTSRVYIQVP